MNHKLLHILPLAATLCMMHCVPTAQAMNPAKTDSSDDALRSTQPKPQPSVAAGAARGHTSQDQDLFRLNMSPEPGSRSASVTTPAVLSSAVSPTKATDTDDEDGRTGLWFK